MIELNIPGRDSFQLEHLVCDVNGTLAVDGKLLLGVRHALVHLREQLQVHLITADSHHQQKMIDEVLQMQAVQLEPGNEAEQKAAYVRSLGSDHVVAIGQGANDTLMLKEAVLGICVQSPEGTAVAAILHADLLVPDIFAAFELLEKPRRIVATLRQ
jgi:P-type E1-E2 ATPase